MKENSFNVLYQPEFTQKSAVILYILFNRVLDTYVLGIKFCQYISFILPNYLLLSYQILFSDVPCVQYEVT